MLDICIDIMYSDRRQEVVKGCIKNDFDSQRWQTCELLRTGDNGGVASKRSGLSRRPSKVKYVFDLGIWELCPQFLDQGAVQMCRIRPMQGKNHPLPAWPSDKELHDLQYRMTSSTARFSFANHVNDFDLQSMSLSKVSMSMVRR